MKVTKLHNDTEKSNRRHYIRPVSTVVNLANELMIIEASPGVGDDPFDPSLPFDSPRHKNNVGDDAGWDLTFKGVWASFDEKGIGKLRDR